MIPRRYLPSTPAYLLALLTPVLAAHPGHDHPFEELDEFDVPDAAHALLHPFTGLDHLLAALTIGVLAFVLGRRLGGLLSLCFLGSLAMGWALAKIGLNVPMLEQGIALSVLAAGLLILFRTPASNEIRFAAVAAMGLWHGGAHGVEMPATTSALGLLLGTALLIGSGSALATLGTRRLPGFARAAGATVAFAGVILVALRLA